MSSSELKLAIVGCGGIARRHVIAMKELHDRGLGGYTISAVCDANLENAHNIAEEVHEWLGHTPVIYTSQADMLEKETLDGADLCLPHGLHHSFATECMEAGVDVLCEKPIGVTIKAGKQMIDAAKRTGRILSIAVPHRRQPGQRAAHWVFNESKLIGEPLTFFHHYTRPPQPRASNEPLPERVLWRRNRMMSGGGMTLDSGFHYCDSIRYFFGDVEKVYAEMREIGSGKPISVHDSPEDTIFVTLSFKSGLVGTWCWSIAAPGEAHAHVTFYGSEGSLKDTTDSPYRIYHLFERRPDGHESGELLRQDGTTMSLDEVEQMHADSLSEEERESLFPGGTADGFAIEIWEFIQLLQGIRQQPEVDGWEGLKSLAIGEAMYESAFTGDVIYVDDILSGERSSFQDPIDEHWGL